MLDRHSSLLSGRLILVSMYGGTVLRYTVDIDRLARLSFLQQLGCWLTD